MAMAQKKGMDRYPVIRTYGTKESLQKGMDRLCLRDMDGDFTFWAAGICISYPNHISIIYT